MNIKVHFKQNAKYSPIDLDCQFIPKIGETIALKNGVGFKVENIIHRVSKDSKIQSIDLFVGFSFNVDQPNEFDLLLHRGLVKNKSGKYVSIDSKGN